MLSSQRFADAIEGLRKMYDVVVIDSPPMQMVSDAMVLSRFATAVLFVVKADSTPYPLARESIIRLHRVKAPVLGAVLNRFDVERAQKYYDDYSGLEAHYYNKYGSAGYAYTYGVANPAGTPARVTPLARLKNFVKRA
jgi:Mrp family chromosome partitioning ATPase